MQMMVYWFNGLGEECSSVMYSRFAAHGVEYVCVWDWRRREPILVPVADCIAIRFEDKP